MRNCFIIAAWHKKTPGGAVADPINATSRQQPANVSTYAPAADGALQSQAELPQAEGGWQQQPVRRNKPGQVRPPRTQKQPQSALPQSEKQFVLDQFKNPNADPEGVLHLLAAKTKSMDSAAAALFIAFAVKSFNRYCLDHKIPGQPIFFSEQAEKDIRAIQDHIGHVSKAGSNTFNSLFSRVDTSIEQGLEDLDRKDRIPGNSLRAMKDRLLTQHPHNPKYGQKLNDQIDFWTHAWEAQGRTHAVWDPLLKLSEKGDWAGVKHEVEKQITVIASTSPTQDAVKAYVAMLLTDWADTKPLPPQFKKAVQEAEDRILIRRPAEAAAQIAKVYQDNVSRGGAIAAQRAAEELRRLTAPDQADPLTAALIFNDAQPVIQKISGELLKLAPVFRLVGRQPVPGPNPTAIPIFGALSVAADSASRSPEAEASIKATASGLKALASEWNWSGLPDVNAVEAAAADGNVTLALEMAVQLKASKQSDAADFLVASIRDGFKTLRENTKKSVEAFGKTIAPLEVGKAMFASLVPNAEENWIKKRPDFEKKAAEQLNGVNALGYRLTRVGEAVEKYLPELKDLSSMQKLHNESGTEELRKEPALLAALTLSTASLVETTRNYNTEVLSKITTWPDPNRIYPEYGWSIRGGRNVVRNLNAYRPDKATNYAGLRKPPPLGIGASLLGVSSYLLGMYTVGSDIIHNHETPGWIGYRGWRAYGREGMYVVGAALEGTQLASNIMTKWGGFEPDDKGWRGQAARIAAGKNPVFKNLMKWHSTAFGLWNVAGTINFLVHGDYARAAALGTAAAGNLAGNFPKLLGIRTAEGEALVGLIGSTATEAGSLMLMYLNFRDMKNAHDTIKGYGKNFLVAGGVQPELADQLAEPLPDGRSMGPQLLQVAKYLGVKPADFMQSLNSWPAMKMGKDSMSLADPIVRNTISIQADANGNLVREKKGENIVVLVPIEGQIVEFKYDSISDAVSKDEYYNKLKREGITLNQFLTLNVHANTLKGYDELMSRSGIPLPKLASAH
jgi:hypothetical protein